MILRKAFFVLQRPLVSILPCSWKNGRNLWCYDRHGCIEYNLGQYFLNGVLYRTNRSSSTLVPEPEEEAHVVRNRLSTLSEKEKTELAESELSKLSDIDKKRLRVLELEYDAWQSTGIRVPNEMTNVRWYTLLHTSSASGRRKLYSFWFKREKQKLTEGRKKEKRYNEHIKRQAEKRRNLELLAADQGLPEGRLPVKQTISLFIREATQKIHYYHNLAWAMQFGQPLIIDLSLEEHMRDRERSSLSRQVVDCHGINKVRREPFNFCLTGVIPKGFVSNSLFDVNKPFASSTPITVTSSHYTDLYPKEKLVYLSPDAKHELNHWNHEDIYIIGGLVDLAQEKPITLAKAKREGIRAARLPLDKYVMWQSGGKSLTLDVVMKILCEIKDTGDWVKALSHIPKRKGKLRAQYTEEYKQVMKGLRGKNQ